MTDKDKKAPIFQELEIGEKFIAVSPFSGMNLKKKVTLLNPGLIYDVFVKIPTIFKEEPSIPGIREVSKNCLKVVTGELHYISSDEMVIRVRC